MQWVETVSHIEKSCFALQVTDLAELIMSGKGDIKQFVNCRILYDHQIIREDLWVRDGKILNPEKLFFDDRLAADYQIDCNNAIISPGFIDVQINGKYV